MKVFHSNVIMSVLLTHCDPLTKVALRTTTPWLSRFIKPIQISIASIIDQTTVYEACIRKDAVFVLNGECDCIILTDLAIGKDSVDGYIFVKRRIIYKGAWTFRLHSRSNEKFDFIKAVKLGNLNIMNLLLPIGNIEKCVEIFWCVIYWNTNVEHIQWFLTTVPYMKELFDISCPVHDGCTNGSGYIYGGASVNIKQFTKTVTYLKDRVFSFATFTKWMTTLTRDAKRVDLVKVIGKVTGYIPSDVCRYLARTSVESHEFLYSLCGHVTKPEKKRVKR